MKATGTDWWSAGFLIAVGGATEAPEVLPLRTGDAVLTDEGAEEVA